MEERNLTADDLVITDRLTERPSRAPDYAVESQALGALAKELSDRPENLLQKLAETLVQLGIADSAGISIEETKAVHQFRWVALAGVWNQLRGSTIPFDASPCGLAVRRDQLLLIERPDRFYVEARVEPLIHEGLLLPFHVDGRPVGTLWVNAHNPTRKFDGEDARLLESLARFASAGFRTVQALEEAQAGKDDLEQRVAAQVAELKASEEKYRTLFENMGQGYALGEVIRDEHGHAIDLRYLELNPAFERLSGIPVAQAQGRTVLEVYGKVEPEWIEVADRVARLKVPERVEYEIGAIGRWFQMHFYPAEGNRYLGLYEEVTERKRAEAALRESEERQAFLLALSDTLRAEDGIGAVGNRATSMIAERLNLDRVYLVTVNEDGSRIEVTHEARRSEMPPMLGVYDGADFSGPMKEIFEHTIVYDDVHTHPGLSDQDRRAMAGLGAGGFVGVPVRRGNDAVIWAAGAVSKQPRSWSPLDVIMLEDAVERTWAAVERARADAALRESEARFRQFADASSGALWIRDGATLKMEYVSRAIADIYGVDPDTFLNGVEVWASSIVPDDRDPALAHLEQARQGEAVVHEFRIRRANDQAFRWIRNIDFPLYDEQGRVQRIGGIAEDVTKAKLAVEHQGVLLAELQHRVRNIMAIIRSMALRSADGASSVDDYRSSLEGRLLALARVQVLLTREANAGGSLRDVIESEVAAQADSRTVTELEGPDIQLSPKAVEVLTLAFHELATNALKYGAFSAPDGRLHVSWAPFEKRGRAWLGLDWTEEGAPERPPPTRRGFGSELIEGRIPYELGGTGKVTIGPGGAHCRLEFPLKDGESILETDAPTPTVVFGGALDMTDSPSLAGRRVLVVEDDYYLAGDTAAALRGAGAEVLGPCPGEDATFDLLDSETPTHAVLDLNLGGGGPRFEIAHELKARGVPFLFLTGYDPGMIPEELEYVVRLQKPVPFKTIVEAVSRL